MVMAWNVRLLRVDQVASPKGWFIHVIVYSDHYVAAIIEPDRTKYGGSWVFQGSSVGTWLDSVC